jgi:hypothetical protein
LAKICSDKSEQKFSKTLLRNLYSSLHCVALIVWLAKICSDKSEQKFSKTLLRNLPILLQGRGQCQIEVCTVFFLQYDLEGEPVSCGG